MRSIIATNSLVVGPDEGGPTLAEAELADNEADRRDGEDRLGDDESEGDLGVAEGTGAGGLAPPETKGEEGTGRGDGPGGEGEDEAEEDGGVTLGVAFTDARTGGATEVLATELSAD